jgi:hypothetical protein
LRERIAQNGQVPQVPQALTPPREILARYRIADRESTDPAPVPRRCALSASSSCDP